MITTDIGAVRTLTGGAARWSAELNVAGFTAIGHTELRDLMPASALTEFAQQWDGLARDQAVCDGGMYRYRRYGRLKVAARNGRYTFEPLPHTAFRQEAAHVPDYAGHDRLFSPIPAGTLLSPVLTSIVAADLLVASALTPAPSWIAGLHMIRVVAQDGALGKPTPEGRHRDGHDYIGMHLIGRRDCTGGESVIYRDGRPPVRLTLAQCLDTLIVDDTALTHEVTPIAAVRREGVRDTLLVDLNVDRDD